MSGSYSVPSVAGSASYGAYTNPMNDLDRRMDNVDLGHARKTSVGDYSGRRRSTYTEAPIAGQAPSSPYQTSIAPPSPMATAANPGYAPAAGYGVSPYPPVGPGAGDPYQRAASPSPYHEQAILSRSRAPSPNPMGGGGYGQRSRAPSPIPGAFGGNRSRAPSPNPGSYAPQHPRSRAASPLPGAAPLPYGYPQPGYPPGRSPNVGSGAVLAGPEQSQMLPPPDGFSRPANLAQSYTFFETMKIQDMDDFYDNIPRMPMVLVPHDVYHEDWIRLCQVLCFLPPPLALFPRRVVEAIFDVGPRAGVGRKAPHSRPESRFTPVGRDCRARRPLEQLVFRLAWRGGRPLQGPRATLRTGLWPNGTQPPRVQQRGRLGLERPADFLRFV